MSSVDVRRIECGGRGGLGLLGPLTALVSTRPTTGSSYGTFHPQERTVTSITSRVADARFVGSVLVQAISVKPGQVVSKDLP